MMIAEPIRELIATGPLAHLTTLNPDGSPQVTVVWVGIEDDEFVIGHMGVWQKVKNVRRDPRVALSLLGRGKESHGVAGVLGSLRPRPNYRGRRGRSTPALGTYLSRSQRRVSP